MSDYDDITAGWRYSATFQLSTPLAYLQRHGEFSPGPKEPPLIGPAENFLVGGPGFNSYGIWLRELDYKGLGFDKPTESSRATAFGSVRSGSEAERDLISFLKSFRYIVETGETLDQKLTELAELSTSTPANRKVWKKVVTSEPGFPDSFFYRELCCLPGVGVKAAERIYRAGFRTVVEVQLASDEDLLKMKGLGKSLLQKLRGGP